MARPRIEIDKAEFEKLCGLQCKEEEIADWFDCSVDTIERWCKRTYKQSFAEVFSKKRGKGKISLRRSQFRLAETNAAMAIFLGKNYLGQSDNPQMPECNADAPADDALTAALKEEAARLDNQGRMEAGGIDAAE